MTTLWLRVVGVVEVVVDLAAAVEQVDTGQEQVCLYRQAPITRLPLVQREQPAQEEEGAMEEPQHSQQLLLLVAVAVEAQF